MPGFLVKFARAFFGLTGLAAGLLLLAGPAGAFWGDYGEAPPEFFGVRLGDDIRDYPDMLRRVHPANDGANGIADYYREADNSATIAGVPVQNSPVFKTPLKVYYRTYKNKVFHIAVHVLLEDFEKVRQYLDAAYGVTHIPENINEFYHWGLYEVLIEARGNFPIPGDGGETARAAMFAAAEREREGKALVLMYIRYQPLVNVLRKGELNNFKARYRGVRLGDKVENYTFLRAYKQEAPDLTYYHSNKPLGLVRGIPVSVEDYTAYKGVIYRIAITSDKWDDLEDFSYATIADVYQDRLSKYLSKLEKFMGLKNIYPQTYYSIGDVNYTIIAGRLIYTHMPTYWRAMRAKIAYHRNVKPD